MPESTSLSVLISQISYQTPEVCSYRLVSATGAQLPPFEPGAHVEVRLPNGIKRQYSLYNSLGDRTCYEIAIKHEADGRGGSRFFHREARVGQVLQISAPINDFALAEGASKYVLLGAGIGITPIIAMARKLRTSGADFELHYCGRSLETMAFIDDLREICGEQLHLHIDGGDPSRGMPVERLIGTLEPGAQVYCCGPLSLIAAVRDAMPASRRSDLHFETFAALPPATTPRLSERQEVEVADTGQVIQLEPGQTVLEALRNSGCEVASSCEVGTCGSCKVRLLKGDVDHQDFVLTDDEQSDWMIVCVSRPKSSRITLDLAVS